MKKCYIAIGSKGCLILKKFSKVNTEKEVRYLYIDTNKKNESKFSPDDMRILFNDYPYKSGYLRSFGKEMFRMRLYSGDFPDVVDEFYNTKNIEICIVTTSFGGFGSAVVFDVADYMCAKITKISNKKAQITIKTIAFSKKQFDKIFKDSEKHAIAHELNEYEFVNEAKLKNSISSKFFPKNEVFLIYSPYLTEKTLHEVLFKSKEDLEHDDIKERYNRIPKIDTEDVFVSYSSLDQDKADALVNTLNKQKVGAWISSRNMKSGDFPCQIAEAIKSAKIFVVLISKNSLDSRHVKSEVNIAFDQRGKNLLIPLFIDDSKLDDSFGYYLNTSQHYYAKQPPIDEQITDLCREIKQRLETDKIN